MSILEHWNKGEPWLLAKRNAARFAGEGASVGNLPIVGAVLWHRVPRQFGQCGIPVEARRHVLCVMGAASVMLMAILACFCCLPPCGGRCPGRARTWMSAPAAIFPGHMAIVGTR